MKLWYGSDEFLNLKFTWRTACNATQTKSHRELETFPFRQQYKQYIGLIGEVTVHHRLRCYGVRFWGHPIVMTQFAVGSHYHPTCLSPSIVLFFRSQTARSYQMGNFPVVWFANLRWPLFLQMGGGTSWRKCFEGGRRLNEGEKIRWIVLWLLFG